MENMNQTVLNSVFRHWIRRHPVQTYQAVEELFDSIEDIFEVIWAQAIGPFEPPSGGDLEFVDTHVASFMEVVEAGPRNSEAFVKTIQAIINRTPSTEELAVRDPFLRASRLTLWTHMALIGAVCGFRLAFVSERVLH